MAPISILLVEDDEIDAMNLLRAIRKSQVEIGEVKICKYAEDALLTFDSWVPGCVFLD